MDLPKLVSLFCRKALWFTRLDKLTDQYEGTLPFENKVILYESFIKSSPLEDPQTSFNKAIKHIDNIHLFKEWTLINSWSIGHAESYALWKIYLASSKYGVAIKSTVGNFIQAIKNSDFPITPVSVNYYEPVSEPLKHLNQETLSGSKNIFYNYESEFRALILDQYIDQPKEQRTPKFENGVYVPVNLFQLINYIVLSPNAPDWFSFLVHDLIQKYEIQAVIQKSLINDKL